MLTLETLLNALAPDLQLVVEGQDRATERPLLWFHNTELPDPARYVRQSEAILTNGLWRGQASAESFVAAIASASAAGIIFGLTTDSPRVPRDLTNACRASGLPLLSLSVDVPFTAVTEAAARLHAEGRQDALAGMVRRSNALATAISRGAGAAGVLGILRRDHDLPLAVVDKSGRELAAVGCELDAEQVAAASRLLSGRSQSPEIPRLGQVTLYSVTGAVGGVDAGLFCLIPAADLSAAQKSALDQAALFLSLEVAKQQAVQAIEGRFSGEVLEMILSGPTQLSELGSRLRSFGVDPLAPLAVLVVGLAGGDALPATVGEDLQNVFATNGYAVVVIPGTDYVFAIFNWSSDSPSLRTFTGTVLREISRRPGAAQLVIGLGESVQAASRLRESAVRAREACHVLKRRPGGPRIASFSEVGTHSMLLGLLDGATLQRFAEDVLGPIRQNDRAHGTELERTLRVFLDNDGQWGVTASELFVHVNTLRNRLARVTELTGRDLSRFAERVNLFLALEGEMMS